MTDREEVWAEMAKRFPEFKPEYDIANNHHAVREIILGGSVPWAGVWHRFTLQPGMRIMDVGANTGVFSIGCALKGAHVEAYEPHEQTCEKVWQLVRANRWHLAFLPIAVWTQLGTLPFLSHESPLDDGATRFNGSLQSDGIAWTPDDLTRAKKIPCTTLKNAIGGHSWDMVKMDIEGAECEVILATPDEALRQIRFMYLELHPWVSAELYEATLAKLQNVFRFEGAYFNHEIKRWEAVYLHAKD